MRPNAEKIIIITNIHHTISKRMMIPIKSLTIRYVFLIYAFFTGYFYFLLYTLLPFLKKHCILHPALYWFILGYFLFIPLFLFAILAVQKEKKIENKKTIHLLNISAFTKRDWKYAIIGLICLLLLSGMIFFISHVFYKLFGFKPLQTTPWFIEFRPFMGLEKLYLFIWLPMFFFNIVGEEILWRGFLQSRIEKKRFWVISSVLWMFFHLPFGLDLIIVLIPTLIIIPYCFYKTQNTLVGIFIHGLYNGPLFIALSLGLLK